MQWLSYSRSASDNLSDQSCLWWKLSQVEQCDQTKQQAASVPDLTVTSNHVQKTDLHWWSGLAFIKKNSSWIEMFPCLFGCDFWRNLQFAIHRFVLVFLKTMWNNLHSNLFASHQHCIKSICKTTSPKLVECSSIGPTPFSLQGTLTEFVGSCLWLNPGLLLMAVRCHCGGIKADLWAWQRVWVTNPSESVDGKDRGQIWGWRKSGTSQWHTARSCARGLGMIGKKICRAKISKSVLHYLTLSVRVQKSASHYFCHLWASRFWLTFWCWQLADSQS